MGNRLPEGSVLRVLSRAVVIVIIFEKLFDKNSI